ncbi:MAG: ATP-binding protein [Verrucomicrobiota bacterium]|nr:ATP-binding protein [Verrucomicrobiota bacterium]
MPRKSIKAKNEATQQRPSPNLPSSTALLRALPHACAVLDPSGTIVAANERWLGLRGDGLVLGRIGNGLQEWAPSTDLSTAIRSVLDKPGASVTVNYGECSAVINPIAEGGALVTVVSSAVSSASASPAHNSQSVSKPQDEHLEMLKQLVEGADAVIILHDLEGRYLQYYAPAKYEYTYEMVRGKQVQETLSPVEAERRIHLIQQVVASGKRIETTDTTLWKGQHLRFHEIYFPVFDSVGKTVAVGRIARNVTEQTRIAEELLSSESRARQQLALSEEKFRRIFEAAPCMIAIWPADESPPLLNKTAINNLGWSSADFNTTDKFLELIGDDLSQRALLRGYLQKSDGTFSDQLIKTKYRGVRIQRWAYWKMADGNCCGLGMDVTDDRAKDRALQESREQFNQIARTVPGALYRYERWPDGSHGFTYFSEGIETITGNTLVDILGDADILFKRVPQEARAKLLESTLLSEQTLNPWDQTFPIERADGTQIWVHGNAIPTRSGPGWTVWHGILTDVTDVMILQKAVTESEVRYRSVFENSPVCLWEEDFSAVRMHLEKLKFIHGEHLDNFLKGNLDELKRLASAIIIKNVNQATLTLYGARNRLDLIQGLPTLFTRESWDVFHQEMMHIVEGKRNFDLVIPSLTLKGKQLYLLARWTALPGHEEDLKKIVLSVEDITTLKETEASLRAAKEKAESANRAKDSFLAVISHEIRTPMNAIVGFADLLNQANTSEDRDIFLQQLRASSAQLQELIDNILEYSHIAGGEATVNAEPFSPHSLCNQMAERFCMRAAEKRLNLSLVLSPDLPELLIGDPARLRQIISALMDNAIKFTVRGGVTLSLEVAPLATGEGCLLVGAVEDTGPGIASAMQTKLFAPFEQGDMTITRHHGGIGLGLALCKVSIQLLGGQITVNSTLGVGTKVQFSVRCERLPNISSASAAPMEHLLPSTQHALPLKLIYAEEHKSNQFVVKALAERLGATLALVSSGKELMEQLKAAHFDAVLINLHISDDGLAIARAIRGGVCGIERMGIYLVAVAAYDHPSDRPHVLAQGFDYYLPKPVTLHSLETLLASVRDKPDEQGRGRN